MSDLNRIRQSVTNAPSVSRAGVKTGAETVALTDEDFFDRIINLRVIHKPAGPGLAPKTFTIRSDYEVEYDASGFYRYIISKQKPMISVAYKQVANATVVELNVDVTNLFIKDPSEYEKINGPVQQIEIQMGYRTQMPDWVTDPFWRTQPVEAFLALKDTDIASGSVGQVSPIKLVAQVLSVQRLGSPPDMVTRFQCVVGTLENGLRWNADQLTKSRSTNYQVSRWWAGRVPVNGIPDSFFALVTRRFMRSTQRHDLHEETIDVIGKDGVTVTKEVVSQSVTIYDDTYTVPTMLTLTDGRMTQEDADDHGTLVFLSDTLWSHPLEELPAWGLSEEEAAQVVPIEQEISFETWSTAPSQMEGIVKQYPFIRFYALGDGNYYAYHVKEKKEDFFKDPFTLDRQEKKSILQLPAVYDITWGGTRQIRMPFWSLIGSMQTVAFQARYALNDITGNFYYPKPGNNCFLVLLVDVSFDTAGRNNEMTLTCVDVTGSYTPATVNGAIVPAKPATVDNAPKRNKLWKQVALEVVYSYKGDPNTTDSSWASIVQLLLSSASNYLDTTASVHWASPPTAQDAIDFVAAIEENADLFTSSRTGYAVSGESAVFGRTLPVLFGKEHNPFNEGHGDVVHVRLPFLPPEYYTDDTRIT
jgi:hypothetical protein